MAISLVDGDRSMARRYARRPPTGRGSHRFTGAPLHAVATRNAEPRRTPRRDLARSLYSCGELFRPRRGRRHSPGHAREAKRHVVPSERKPSSRSRARSPRRRHMPWSRRRRPGPGSRATGAGQAGEEYVVAFTGTPDAAAAAIHAAGGTVENVTGEVGVALVPHRRRVPGQGPGRGEVRGAARNHAVGTAQPGMPHRFAEERPRAAERGGGGQRRRRRRPRRRAAVRPPVGHADDRRDAGRGPPQRRPARESTSGSSTPASTARHPDLAPNFDAARSRNFTTDIPAIDGPCEVRQGARTRPTWTTAGTARTSPASWPPRTTTSASRRGPGRHARQHARRSGLRLLLPVRDGRGAGVRRRHRARRRQHELLHRPWLYNCTSRDEYLRATVTDEELAEQRLVREKVRGRGGLRAPAGVTLVGSAGNELTNLATPTRVDDDESGLPAGRRPGANGRRTPA